MMTVNLSVLPADEEESVMVLNMASTLLQSLALKGISVSVSVNTYGEDEEEHKEDNG
jgi:hypothetical protein